MKSLKFALLALASTIALYACGNTTSSADTGVTQAQVQSMIAAAIAPLQSQIATLQQTQTSAPAVFINAPNAPAVAVASKAQSRGTSQKATTAAPTCTGLGTLTGRPDTSDPITSNNISGVSCSGYYFTVSGAATSADTSTVQPLPSAAVVWYDAPGCTGNAYVTVTPNGGQSLSEGALANGAVFTVGSTYWMLKPGTASSQPNLMSRYQDGQCSTATVSALVVYELVPNDQTVSGVPSAPIPGPVTIQ